MWSPLVARRTSRRYSSSCHVLWGMSAGIAVIAFLIRDMISSGRSPCYQGSPHRGLLRSVKNFQSFAMTCRKPHAASSICLRATIFQNPEGTLWTHCITLYAYNTKPFIVIEIKCHCILKLKILEFSNRLTRKRRFNDNYNIYFCKATSSFKAERWREKFLSLSFPNIK
jgi:hypothetical protein